jgi:hypothetical protein
MNAIWIVVGLGLAIVVSTLVALWRRTDQVEEMGAVSHQWLAEHRHGTIQDSPR